MLNGAKAFISGAGASDVYLVMARTGARSVDLIAYSAGISVARTWVQLDGGAQSVTRLVDLDGSWSGDDDSPLLARIRRVPFIGPTIGRSLPLAEYDLQRTSPLQAELARQTVPSSLQLTSIFPERLATLDVVPGARNVPIPGDVSHVAMARSSDLAYDAARGALLATTDDIRSPQ